MYRIGDYLYKLCPTGHYLCCGKVIIGIDGEYIQWYL